MRKTSAGECAILQTLDTRFEAVSNEAACASKTSCEFPSYNTKFLDWNVRALLTNHTKNNLRIDWNVRALLTNHTENNLRNSARIAPETPRHLLLSSRPVACDKLQKRAKTDFRLPWASEREATRDTRAPPTSQRHPRCT